MNLTIRRVALYALVSIIWSLRVQALPQKIVIKNDTNNVQKVLIYSSYVLSKSSKPYTKKERVERVTCDLRPHTSYTYGASGHEFDKLEVKLGPEVPDTVPPASTHVVRGLGGVKSVVTITAPGTYKVDVRESFKKRAEEVVEHTKEKALEAQDAIKRGAQETAQHARQAGAAVSQKVREKAHEAKDTASEYAQRAKVKVAHAKERASSRWTRMKCWWYGRWCSFKKRVKYFFAPRKKVYHHHHVL